ncbi:MAG: amylosucrase [Thiolinea sp.]
MYQPDSHVLLTRILDRLETKPDSAKELQPFLTRLAANFHSMHKLFITLYGTQDDAEAPLGSLIKLLLKNYQQRTATLRAQDKQREQQPDWFLSQNWVGMALYCDRFADDLSGVREQINYLQDLGINLLHILPIMQCPTGANDGGYAISDFRQVDSQFGNLKDIAELSDSLKQREMLLTLDIVINHTSDEHEWAKQAKQGSKTHQNYYYLYPDRTLPDLFEQTMPEIFPENAPGSFTWDEDLQQWVMTVFNTYQWDLNYRNPAVFTEMVDIILYWANQGADILRLDAPAFIWKQAGTTSQNLPQAHQILQLFKDCIQIVCPGVLLIAEAIVSPREIINYFGGHQPEEHECDIAYNATFMALLWDAVATGNARVMNQALRSQPSKPERTTWLNYIRCHDDIGLGFDDADIAAAGLDPSAHRRYLKDFFSGQRPDSSARGLLFGVNKKTDDARISGSLASLAGLEMALEAGDEAQVNIAIQRILTLHALIMSWGGISLLYYGDELALTNDYSYREDADNASDNRWVHRPKIDWPTALEQLQGNTPQGQVYSGLQQLIRIRKQTPVFADFNNRQLLWQDNQHLFTFSCEDPKGQIPAIVVVANFEAHPHYLNLRYIREQGYLQGELFDCASEKPVAITEDHLVMLPPCGFYWLESRGV